MSFVIAVACQSLCALRSHRDHETVAPAPRGGAVFRPQGRAHGGSSPSMPNRHRFPASPHVPPHSPAALSRRTVRRCGTGRNHRSVAAGSDYVTSRLDPERETRRLIAKLEARGHTAQPNGAVWVAAWRRDFCSTAGDQRVPLVRPTCRANLPPSGLCLASLDPYGPRAGPAPLEPAQFRLRTWLTGSGDL